MANSSTEDQNPKLKDQRKSKIQSSKIKTNSKQFWILDFRFWICFGFWILNIGFLLGGCGDIETELASLTISPSSATIGINQTRLFSATGKDSLGKIVSISPTWSVIGGIGTISSTGLFTAGSATGEGYVVASYEGISAQASVTVTDKGWIQGRVTDNYQYRVGNLKVYLKNTSLYNRTNSQGDYSISNVPPGITYEVWTERTTIHREESREAYVGSGETVTVDFVVERFAPPPDLTPPEEFTP